MCAAWAEVTSGCCAAGSSSQEDVEPSHRKGALWDTYRHLVAEGWTPDVHSYTTSFRSVIFLTARDFSPASWDT